MPASPTEVTEAAREGAREGTAVGMSSVAPTTTAGISGQEKTRPGPEGRLEDGEGTCSRLGMAVSRGAIASEIRTVLSTNASISSVEDCVGKIPAGGSGGKLGVEAGSKGSGECCCDHAEASEPGPED